MSKKKIVRNKDEKIKEIFQTFLNLINKQGYDKITTRKIAEGSNLSIGTIYRYFPQGKASILSEFLIQEKDKIFNYDSILKNKQLNLPDFLKSYVTSHLQTHREYYEIHKAFDQALLSNKELFNTFDLTVTNIFKEIAKKIKDFDVFQTISEEELVENIATLYNLMDGIIHRHLFIMELFETDEELIEFLLKLVLFVIKDRIKSIK